MSGLDWDTAEYCLVPDAEVELARATAAADAYEAELDSDDDVDLDALLADAELMLAEVSSIARFNMNHAPPGAGGGEFTTAAGAGGGAAAAASAKPAKTAKGGPDKAARDRMHARARQLRDSAKLLTRRLHALVAQLRQQVANAKAAAASARHSKTATNKAKKSAAHARGVAAKQKAATKKSVAAGKAAAKKTTTTAKAAAPTSASQSVKRLHARITGLRARIKGMLAQADALDARARRSDDLDYEAELSRAGKWRHGWEPLDFEAAHSKFHGRVPGGWSPGGGHVHGGRGIAHDQGSHAGVAWAHHETTPKPGESPQHVYKLSYGGHTAEVPRAGRSPQQAAESFKTQVHAAKATGARTDAEREQAKDRIGKDPLTAGGAKLHTTPGTTPAVPQGSGWKGSKDLYGQPQHPHTAGLMDNAHKALAAGNHDSARKFLEQADSNEAHAGVDAGTRSRAVIGAALDAVHRDQAGKANAQSITHQMALAHAKRVKLHESTGLASSVLEGDKAVPGVGEAERRKAHDALMAGDFAGADKILAAEQARLAGSTIGRDRKDAAWVGKVRAQISKAASKQKPTVPPLHKIGSHADGSLTAIDHKGRSYRVSYAGGQVTVTGPDGKTMSRPADNAADATSVARELAGELTGERGTPAKAARAPRAGSAAGHTAAIDAASAAIDTERGGGSGFRATRVAAQLAAASKAIGDGDQAAALERLKGALTDARGAGSARVPAVMLKDGKGSAAGLIQGLIDQVSGKSKPVRRGLDWEDQEMVTLRAGFDPGLHPRDPHGEWARSGAGHSDLPWSATGPGTAVTYHGHMGIDRADMPQLSGNVGGTYKPSSEMVPKFMDHLAKQGIAVHRERVDSRSLKPTQTSGDMAAIRGIADNLRSGELKDTKPITVSSDNRVLDGHHNWAGRVLADSEGGRPGLEPGMPVVRVGLPMSDLIKQAQAFGKIHGIAQRKTGEMANPKFANREPATRRVADLEEGLAHPATPTEEHATDPTGTKINLRTGNEAPETGASDNPPTDSELKGYSALELYGLHLNNQVSAAQFRKLTGKTPSQWWGRQRPGTRAPDIHLPARRANVTHERRDFHGRWTKGGAGPSPAGSLAHAAAKAAPAAAAVDSLTEHSPGGQLTPERARLHQQIIAGMLAGHHPSQHPTATFFGGGSASGKSSLVQGPDSVKIDADEIKGMLPEYQQMVRDKDPRAAAYAHEESSLLAKQVQAAAIKNKLNFTLDGTGDSSYDKMAGKLAAARKAGYKVDGQYVTVDTDEAIRRAEGRARKTGRMVPPTVIREVHQSVSAVLPKLIENGMFDSLKLWDNNGEGAAHLIGEKPPGGKWAVHDPGAWARFVAKADQGGGPAA